MQLPEALQDKRTITIVAAAAALSFVVVGLVVAFAQGRVPVPRSEANILVGVTTISDAGERTLDLAALVHAKRGAEALEVILFPTAVRVDVAGVTDDRLREVYAFGGSALAAKAFSTSVKVPVDAAIVLDEPQVVRWLTTQAGVSLDIPGSIEVFRHERYTAFSKGQRATLTPAETLDLVAAAGLPEAQEDDSPAERGVLPAARETAPAPAAVPEEPQTQDTKLQARVVAAVLRAMGSDADVPLLKGSDVWMQRMTSGQLKALVTSSGWPRVKLDRATGSFRTERYRSYWQPDPSAFEGRSKD